MMTAGRVAIYARVSTTEQAEEGYSIEAQVEVIKNTCKLEGKEVVAIYEDRGISGKSISNRLELQKLLEDSAKGLFDELFVWKTSRLARNMLDLLQIVKELEKNDVKFRSITEAYDTSTPTGRLMMSMLATFAEFERTTIIENLKMGMNARARQGHKNGGKLLGYRSVGKGKESKLEVVPEEAEIVKKVFDMYVDGQGYKAIANKLNKNGYRSVKGNLFGITAISNIISNPTYIGKIRFNWMVDWSGKRRSGKNDNYILADGLHKAIVSEHCWNKAQEIKAVRSEKYPRTYSGEFPLTGLLRCPKCGSGMVAARTTNTLKDGSKKKIRYYSCGMHRNKGTLACNANSVRADEAEKYVFKRIKKVMLNKKMLEDIVKNLNETRLKIVKPLELEIAHINKQKETYLERKRRVFDLYEMGELPSDLLKERLKEIEAHLEQLELRKIEINRQIALNSSEPIPLGLVKEAMTDFEKLITNADKEQRKMFLQLIINKITVGEDRKIDNIEIHFNETLRSMIKHFLGGESSEDEDSPPSFIFSIAI
jgi:site-specific DNA recombinase